MHKYFSDAVISVRLIRDADIPAVIDLINHAFRRQDAAKGEKRINEKMLRERIAKSEFYVWEDDRSIVACAYMHLHGDSFYFGLFCVAEHMRGSGLAQKMMTGIELYARDQGAACIELDFTSASAPLQKYYEQYGFKITGETEDIGWARLIKMKKTL